MQEELLKDNSWSRELLCKIDAVKSELKAFEVQDAKRAAYRCRLQWDRMGRK